MELAEGSESVAGRSSISKLPVLCSPGVNPPVEEAGLSTAVDPLPYEGLGETAGGRLSVLVGCADLGAAAVPPRDCSEDMVELEVPAGRSRRLDESMVRGACSSPAAVVSAS